eukprot:g2926.t1
MRLLQPDDELGATLLLSMPSIVVHRIDAWSPLAPHRPDLYGPAPLAPPSPMGDEPLPHVESALAKAHGNQQPDIFARERSGTIATFSSWNSTLNRGGFGRQTSEGCPPRFARANSSNALQSATKPRERGGGYEENLRIRRWPWPRQRQASNEIGQGDSCACPTCGETFPTAETLKSHCRYSAASDLASGMPKEEPGAVSGGKEGQRHGREVRYGQLTPSDTRSPDMTRDPTKFELSQYLARSYKEVVVIVEGIEPTTSATLQSRHSYLVGPPDAEDTDTAWDMDFVDCIMVPEAEEKAKSGGLGVDLGRFHMLTRVDEVTAGHQRRGDARRYAPARARGLANLNSLLRPVTPPPKPPQGAQAWASMRPTMPRPATPRECRTPSQA